MGTLRLGSSVVVPSVMIPSGSANIQSLSITPTTSQQTITATAGVNGYSPITVSAVDNTIDANITSSNIKSGVTILGVSGSVVELNGQTKNVSLISTGSTTITPDSGYNALTSVTVEPTNYTYSSVTPTTSQTVLSIPSNYSGLNAVTVDPVTSSIDANIVAGNIKKNVEILGVTGSYEGITPTGTLSISQNGTYDVTNYATASVTVSGGGGYTEIPRYEITNGVVSARTLSLTGHEFDGITDINHYGLYYAFSDTNTSGPVVFNDLTTISGTSALDHAFYSTHVTSISFPELVTITGNFGSYAFANLSQSYITSVSFPKLTNAKGMQNLISGNSTGLRSIDFSSLTSIDNNGMINFANPSDTVIQKSYLTSISFPELLTIGNYGLANAFGWSSNCTSISFPKLTAVGAFGLQNTFRLNKSLTSVSFPMLTTLGSYALNQAFMQINNLSLSFPALTSNSFGSYTNQFNNMLYLGSNNTVHFPSNLQSVISSWSDVTNGFGGTSTTVLYDLPATE